MRREAFKVWNRCNLYWRFYGTFFSLSILCIQQTISLKMFLSTLINQWNFLFPFIQFVTCWFKKIRCNKSSGVISCTDTLDQGPVWCKMVFPSGLNCEWEIFNHDDLMTWKGFPHYWSYVRGIQWSLLVSFIYGCQLDDPPGFSDSYQRSSMHEMQLSASSTQKYS